MDDSPNTRRIWPCVLQWILGWSLSVAGNGFHLEIFPKKALILKMPLQSRNSPMPGLQLVDPGRGKSYSSRFPHF